MTRLIRADQGGGPRRERPSSAAAASGSAPTGEQEVAGPDERAAQGVGVAVALEAGADAVAGEREPDEHHRREDVAGGLSGTPGPSRRMITTGALRQGVPVIRPEPRSWP